MVVRSERLKAPQMLSHDDRRLAVNKDKVAGPILISGSGGLRGKGELYDCGN